MVNCVCVNLGETLFTSCCRLPSPTNLQGLLRCCHNRDARILQAYIAAQSNPVNFYHNLQLALKQPCAFPTTQ